MLEEVHFPSVRQAEQRNNEEEHGAKRGVRGLYKLGQRVLTESPHRTSPRNAICSSLPTACARVTVAVQVQRFMKALRGAQKTNRMIHNRHSKRMSTSTRSASS